LAKLVDASPTCLQAALRVFEKNLLIEAGYGLNLSRDAKTGLVIDPNKTYIFEPELGFYTMQFIPPEQALQGTTLLALHEDTLHSAQALREAKIITRFALARYLSTKPLHSKALLQALIKRKSL
jgi:DNA repair protein RecO (recombination protein O)